MITTYHLSALVYAVSQLLTPDFVYILLLVFDHDMKNIISREGD